MHQSTTAGRSALPASPPSKAAAASAAAAATIAERMVVEAPGGPGGDGGAGGTEKGRPLPRGSGGWGPAARRRHRSVAPVAARRRRWFVGAYSAESLPLLPHLKMLFS